MIEDLRKDRETYNRIVWNPISATEIKSRLIVSGSSRSESGRYLKIKNSWASELTRLRIPVVTPPDATCRDHGLLQPLIAPTIEAFFVGSLGERGDLFQGTGRLRNATTLRIISTADEQTASCNPINFLVHKLIH